MSGVAELSWPQIVPVRIGFEAIDNYHRGLAHPLGQPGFIRRLLSSVSVATTREDLHNSWDKSDPNNTQIILHVLEIGDGAVLSRSAGD